jgi:hypothetical protein
MWMTYRFSITEIITGQVTRYELPTDPAFQNQFMLALNFPHITHLIPDHKPDTLTAKFMGDKK